jgi:hypothetical protein
MAHHFDLSRPDFVDRRFDDSHRRLAVIGWREWVALPKLDTRFIEAKIDTGARHSSIDASITEEFRRGRIRWVRFALYSDVDLSFPGELVEAPLVGYRDVRSSNGQVSRRPVIETDIRIGLATWSIELSLTNRRAMGFRLLLGRSAVEDRFLVDVSKSYLATQ